jgi:HD-like signal output (HDOD) protein
MPSAAHKIAVGMGYAHPQEAFLTGLLNDLGKLLLWSNFPRTLRILFRPPDQRRAS